MFIILLANSLSLTIPQRKAEISRWGPVKWKGKAILLELRGSQLHFYRSEKETPIKSIDLEGMRTRNLQSPSL
jgi:hypothetical protein